MFSGGKVCNPKISNLVLFFSVFPFRPISNGLTGSGLVVLVGYYSFYETEKTKKIPQKPKIINTEKPKNTEKNRKMLKKAKAKAKFKFKTFFGVFGLQPPTAESKFSILDC